MDIWHCLPVGGLDSQDIRFKKWSADTGRIPGRKFIQGLLIVLTMYSWTLIVSYWRHENNSNNTELIRTSLPVGPLSAYF